MKILPYACLAVCGLIQGIEIHQTKDELADLRHQLLQVVEIEKRITDTQDKLSEAIDNLSTASTNNTKSIKILAGIK